MSTVVFEDTLSLKCTSTILKLINNIWINFMKIDFIGVIYNHYNNIMHFPIIMMSRLSYAKLVRKELLVQQSF